MTRRDRDFAALGACVGLTLAALLAGWWLTTGISLAAALAIWGAIKRDERKDQDDDIEGTTT